MLNYKIQKFPDSRIATIDVCEMGKRKHHVTGLIELDVTVSRKKIKEYNRNHTDKISFTAWIIHVIACTIKKYETASSFLIQKNKRIIFDDINISLVVEKKFDGQKVPIPLIMEQADKRSVESIALQIKEAKNAELTKEDIVLQRKTEKYERFYYILPGFFRRIIWKYVLAHPRLAYRKMGNVSITAIGMMGQVKGWFIPISIHPVCFGLSSIVKKPSVINDKIEIREMLNLSVLLDHDVMDGAPMARFISELSKNIENGLNIS